MRLGQMRRLLLLLPAMLVLLGVWPASADAAPAATLTLLQQSAWNGPGRPLDMRLRVTNGGDEPLTDLSITLTVETPTISRGEYSAAMRSTQPRTAVVSFPFPEPGTIAPGAGATFHLQQSLGALSTTALYPLRVDLLSSLQPVATLRSPMVFLTEAPKLPIALGTTWVLWEPLQLLPDGTLGPGPIEGDVGADGRLTRTVGAIANGPPAVAVAISPVLVEELSTMANGYRVHDGQRIRVVPAGQGAAADASRVLDALRQVASRKATEVVAMPYGDPSLPALAHAGLGEQIGPLTQRGRRVIADALGVTPSTTVARPPFSQIETAAAARVARGGTRLLLLDGGHVPPPSGLKFSPPPVASVSAGARTMAAVVPDPDLARDIQTWIGAPTRADPARSALAAHIAAGELATIYLETPGTPRRGTAVLFPERPAAGPEFLRDFARLVGASPWLRPMTPSALVRAVPGAGTATRLPPQTSPSFPAGYEARYDTGRDALTRFHSAVRGADALGNRLNDDLLLSIGGAAVRSVPVGEEFLAYVNDTVRRVFEDVRPPPSGQLVTLTSLHGTVRFTATNGSPFAMKLVVKLVPHGQLTLPDGDRTTIVLLPGESRLVQMTVQAQTTGRFPMTVQLLAPQGGLIAQSQMIVRSTAFNRVALLVTAGAVLFLLVWWGRRFVPRRAA
jgi:hypothetical protein